MTKGANNKDVRLELRMTSKDKARIEAKAKKEGKSMSDYIRAKTL
jgi:uncharacterized protein (DUF1778 family)|tara:strand:+ start:436 stop:570 length:135 start_codon:yes stop_codon:yes gene_type:complete